MAEQVGYSLPEIRNALNQNNQQLENLIIESGNSNAEVVAARTDSKGTTSVTIGERLDNDNAALQVTISNKRDKNELLELGDLSSEVKTAMTGGSVPVVGAGAVEFGGLAADLSNSLGEYSLIPASISANAFFNRNTGTLDSFNGYQSVKIPCKYGDKLKVTSRVQGVNSALIVFLKSDNTLHSVYNPGTSSLVSYTDENVVVPNGASYAGISSTGSSPQVKKLQLIDVKSQLSQAIDGLSNADKVPYILDNIEDYSNVNAEVIVGAIDNTGALKTSANASFYGSYRAIKINCTPGQQFKVTTKVTGSGVSMVVFYKQDGSVLSFLNQGPTSGTIQYTEEPFTAPPGAYALSITSSNNAAPILTRKEIIVATKNELNSLSQTQTEVLSRYDEEIKNVAFPYSYSGPIIVLVDDDGRSTFLTAMKPVLDEKGVKATVGVITGLVGTENYMTEDQLLTLQSEGYEIISHSRSHSNTIFTTGDSSSVSDADIEAQYTDSKKWLKDNGFHSYETFLYPYGGFTDSLRYKKLARKYYKYAINSGGNTYNSSPFDNMYVKRKFINQTQDFNLVMKPIIDDGVRNNGLLVLGSHSFSTTEFSADYLATMIDYIQSLGIPIMTFGEAIQYKGNALSVGEFTSTKKFFVGSDGNIIMGNVSS